MGYVCRYCGKELKHKKSILKHEKRCKQNPNRIICKCRFCEKICERPGALAVHERVCKSNPDRRPLENNGNGWKFSKRERKEGGWKCSVCGEVFETRKLLSIHRKEKHPEQGGVWNKGLTKDNCESLKRASEKYKAKIKSGEIIPKQLGKPLSEEVKKKISESMKRAHKEGKAHNIGSSRWNNEHSYPEKWLIRVLENEFQMIENKDYRTEMPFGKFSLDFAWPDRKICIELDGDQHNRFEEQKRRDKEKDELLKESGWRELRINWKDCYSRPKYYINIISSLLGSSVGS